MKTGFRGITDLWRNRRNPVTWNIHAGGKVPEPNFLIIGAQKCGTTSLFIQLSQHPEIFMPPGKEVHFFDLYYDRQFSWYLENFHQAEKGLYKAIGEASPYYLFHPLVAQRVAKHIPGIRLIVLLRNPADRAYSHFLHSKRYSLDQMESFETAIETESSRIEEDRRMLISGAIQQSPAFRDYSYISRGMYFRQISHWLKYFPLEQFFFIKSEDFFSSPQSEFSQVCRFLGVSDYSDIDFKPLNFPDYPPNSYPPLPVELKDRLLKVFSDDMAELRNLLGDRFFWT